SNLRYRSSEPLLVLPKKLIIITGSIFGALGCYSCLLYAYVFQYDRVSNFMSSDCPDVRNKLPPTSYPIGDWEPQRFIWMLVMFAHFPARLFFPLFYKCIYGAIVREGCQSKCFRALSYILNRGLIIEALALVIVTVYDVRSDFTLHAVGYGIWLLAFMINAITSALLQHLSGIRALSAKANCTFFIRLAIFLMGGSLCIFTAYAYAVYRLRCYDTDIILLSKTVR
uniref:CWH43-like N-terminal domain-containing protein n=1 Tax=Parascaris univalens TaxID=6257 RepID=A0A915A5N8_PARUN